MKSHPFRFLGGQPGAPPSAQNPSPAQEKSQRGALRSAFAELLEAEGIGLLKRLPKLARLGAHVLRNPQEHPRDGDPLLPHLLSAAQVSEALGISRRKLYGFMNSGDLPWVIVGKNRMILASDLEAWIQRHRATGREP